MSTLTIDLDADRFALAEQGKLVVDEHLEVCAACKGHDIARSGDVNSPCGSRNGGMWSNLDDPSALVGKACETCDGLGHRYVDRFGQVYGNRLAAELNLTLTIPCPACGGSGKATVALSALVGKPCETCDRRAEELHDAYEWAATVEGWETQAQSRKPWSDVPPANKATMLRALNRVWPCPDCGGSGKATVTLTTECDHCTGQGCADCAFRQYHDECECICTNGTRSLRVRLTGDAVPIVDEDVPEHLWTCDYITVGGGRALWSKDIVRSESSEYIDLGPNPDRWIGHHLYTCEVMS